MPHAKHLLGLAIVAGVALSSTSALAFCRTTTTPRHPDDPSQGCAPGMPVFHSSQCLPYRLLAKESAVIPNAVLSDKLARAFSTWTASNPSCTPGITAIELAPATESEPSGFRNGERGRNLVGVVPTWNHAGAGDSLALATLTFQSTTGEILDVDLEINGTAPWSFTSDPPTENDLEAVLTHEVGHILGIAHSPIPEATMFPVYRAGSIDQRSLAQDDQNAICTIYPNKNQRLAGSGLVPSTTCNLAPGDANGNCGDPDISHGCSIQATNASGLGGAVMTALVALGIVITRRRPARSFRDRRSGET